MTRPSIIFSFEPRRYSLVTQRSCGIYSRMKTIALASLILLAPALAGAQQNVPEIPFYSVPDFPKLPDGMNFGEVPGVAVNSAGHVFVFTRSNSAQGPAYAPTAAQLLEFGPDGAFLREVGAQLYGWAFPPR